MGDGRRKTGNLYVVATPIGNLGDITHRALATLAGVDLIAAEDTRHTGKLCAHYGIATPLLAYHEHNEHQQTPVLRARLEAGDDIALVSDAGTPLVSDPGFRLVAAAREAGLTVVPIPGPCAAIAALSVAGLASDRFFFEGFLAARSGARQNRLRQLRGRPETLIFYESVHRLQRSLADMCEVLGGERPALLAREITKLHETMLPGTLAGIAAQVAADPQQRRGEHVIVVSGATSVEDQGAERALAILAAELPLSQAADLAAKITGASRNRLYREALAQARDGDEP